MKDSYTKKLLSRLLFISFFSLLLVFIYLAFLLTNTKAAEPIPPYGKIPCDDNDKRTPNFNSLRPYQASPCGESQKAIYCANAIIIQEEFTTIQNCKGLCPTEIVQPAKEYAVTISDVKLPIYGNTEQVKNSENNEDEYDDATKLNEYLNWYLSGVNGRAEYGDVTADQIINYSGPVKKLLPRVIQEAQRIEIIKTVTDNPVVNHNQIVVCEKLGSAVPCPDGTERTLSDWDARLSTPNTLSNIFLKIVDGLPVWIKGLPGLILEDVTSEAWNERIPPLPWDYKKDIEYQKAYNEWRGKQCITVPILGLLCFDIPGWTNNKWADLYSYVPLTNNSDKDAKIPVERVLVEGKEGTKIEIKEPQYEVKNEPVNMFPHTLASKENLDLLSKTFAPLGVGGEIDYSLVETGRTDTGQCNIVDVRSNEGDNLFTELSPSEVRVKVASYKVTQVNCDEKISSGNDFQFDNNNFIENSPLVENQTLGNSQTDSYRCKGRVQIAISNYSENPYADEVWNSSVAGPTSVFKRIFPKVGENAPVTCIADIPGVSSATYTATAGTKDFSLIDPDGTNVSPENAEMFFPHIGGVYEYFLNGIQTALKPKGYGGTIGSGTCNDEEFSSNCSEGTGFCSVDNLLKYLGNDREKATKASMICNKESGSSPTAKNKSCLKGKTCDYSIGLFQVNILAHCPGAFSDFSCGTPIYCTYGDKNILNTCETNLVDPVYNIKEMVRISNYGTNWKPWKTASKICGIE